VVRNTAVAEELDLFKESVGFIIIIIAVAIAAMQYLR